MFFELRRQGQALCSAKPPSASPFSLGCRDLKATLRPQFSSFCMVHLHTTKKHHTLSCMVLFVELRRGSSTLLRKAASSVPIFFGVHGFEPAKSHLETWSSALLPFGQSAHSLFLRLWLLPPPAPGSGRTQSPGNPSVALPEQKKHHAFA